MSEKMGIDRVCEQCKVEFRLHPRVGLRWAEKTGRGRFCSDKCSRLARRGQRVAPATEFKRMHKVINIQCRCGKGFTTTEDRILMGRGKYCSRICSVTFRQLKTGIDHHNWRGGVSSANDKARKSSAYKKWRDSVYERDGFTCQECGAKGVYLNAHHIKEFADYPLLRFELDNGVTLCLDCHNLTKKGRRLVYG